MPGKPPICAGTIVGTLNLAAEIALEFNGLTPPVFQFHRHLGKLKSRHAYPKLTDRILFSIYIKALATRRELPAYSRIC